MKKIICIDMDDVLCNYTDSYNRALKKSPELSYPQSQPSFFESLPPLKNAISSFEYLNSINNFEVYILTAPSEKNPLCYTEKRLWIESHLGFEMVKKLIISSNKALIKADYLIDDHLKGRGQEDFEGKVLEFGSEKFIDWNAIVNYFTTTYKL